MKEILKFISPYWKKGLLPVLFLLLSTGISLFYPLFPKWAVDFVFLMRHYEKLVFLALLFLILIFLQRLLSYLNETTFFNFQRSTILNIQKDLLARVCQLPLDFFDRKHSGYLVGRIRNDVSGLSYVFSEGIVMVLMDAIRFFAGIFILFTLNIKLTLISLSVVPFLIYKIIRSKEGIRKLNEEILEEHARVEKELSDVFQGVEVLKSFSKEEIGRIKAEKALSKFNQVEIKRNLKISFYRNFIDFTVRIGEVLILYFGIKELILGNLSIGSYIAFNGYLIYLYSPIRNLSYINLYFDYAQRSYKRIRELMDILPENTGEKELENIESIEVKNLSFSYDGERDVLKNINFKIKKGERVLISRESGSGKSTLIKLLLGLYRAKEGDIFYNGVSLNELSKKRLREKIGYISQNIFLFNSTLRENILLGKDCSDDEIEGILKECKLEEKIRRKVVNLKGSLLDIDLSEKGLNFSGGERQLIALARALVKNPDVIILDEAVANLDIETEREIERMIESKFSNSIIIKISHRGEGKGWRVIQLKRLEDVKYK